MKIKIYALWGTIASSLMFRGCFLPTMSASCIHYLLLYKKLPQHLADYNSKHLLFHSFCGSGIWKQLSWYVSPAFLINLQAGCQLKLQSSHDLTGAKNLLPDSLTWLLSDLRISAAKLIQVALSTNLPHNMADGSPRERWWRWKMKSFYNFVSGLTPYHFCCSLCVRSKSMNSVHTLGLEITPGCAY